MYVYTHYTIKNFNYVQLLGMYLNYFIYYSVKPCRFVGPRYYTILYQAKQPQWVKLSWPHIIPKIIFDLK